MKANAPAVAATKPKASNPTALTDADKTPAKSVALEVLPPDPPAKKLKPAETKELERLEVEIAKGYDSFWDVMKAFRAIHDGQLYREYGTFADYCVQRWDFNRDYGQRLIRADGIYRSLEAKFKDTKIPLPTNESQIRPLSKVVQNNWEDAWEAAAKKAGDKPITHAIVAEAAKPFLKPTPNRAAKKPKKPAVIKVADLRPLVSELRVLLHGAGANVQRLLKRIAALMPVEAQVEPKVEVAKKPRKPKGTK